MPDLTEGQQPLPPLQDFSEAASNLFSNIRVPAALVAGAGITLGYAAAPKLVESDLPFTASLKILNALLAIFCLGTELIAVLWSTIEVNKLQEITLAPTRSLIELLERDFDLSWVGANVHFIIGIFMMPAMAAINIWVNFGPELGKIAALGSLTTVLFMASIVNEGVARGAGETRLAGSFFFLVLRYLKLLVGDALGKRRILLCAALASGAATVVAAAVHLM